MGKQGENSVVGTEEWIEYQLLFSHDNPRPVGFSFKTFFMLNKQRATAAGITNIVVATVNVLRLSRS